MQRERVRMRDVQVAQSAVNGAPQCPTCWAHTMIEQADGTFKCPSGCPGHVVMLQGAETRDVIPEDAVEFDGAFGGTFALCGNA